MRSPQNWIKAHSSMRCGKREIVNRWPREMWQLDMGRNQRGAERRRCGHSFERSLVDRWISVNVCRVRDEPKNSHLKKASMRNLSEFVRPHLYWVYWHSKSSANKFSFTQTILTVIFFFSLFICFSQFPFNIWHSIVCTHSVCRVGAKSKMYQKYKAPRARRPNEFECEHEEKKPFPKYERNGILSHGTRTMHWVLFAKESFHVPERRLYAVFSISFASFSGPSGAHMAGWWTRRREWWPGVCMDCETQTNLRKECITFNKASRQLISSCVSMSYMSCCRVYSISDFVPT